MKAMSFYTANGWAGSNYDSKLSTKEIAAKVRSYAKKNFPEFKFSVRSEWSMYTDSMYIELKSGPCVPFIEGSRSAERGYMSTMSNVKAWKDELTPEVFAALNAVSNYASSFRYDDSDGMQDYFDTNFYIHIEVSDEYKVIEPKAKKSSVKPEIETSKDNIIEWKEIPGCGYEGIELEYIGEGKEYGCIGRCDNGTYWGAFGGVQGSTSGLAPVRKVFDNETDLLNWMKSNGFVYEKKCTLRNSVILEEPQGNDTPLIIDDYAKYDSFDYPTIPEELDGFRLGEVVYDQCGEIGVILAFNEKNGTAREISNGCCDVGKLKKCPKEIAEREVKHMDIIS